MTRTSLPARILRAFRDTYSAEPTSLIRAPGRVNLIGEHTDYNDGFVLPCALQFETVVAAGPCDDASIETLALDCDGARDRFDPAADIAPLAPGAWQNHIRGVAAELARTGSLPPGARLVIGGNVPQGAGLSSSASLGVATAAALGALADAPADPTAMARIAHASENNFVGCACGIMDQLVSARAEVGAALLIDCRTLAARAVPIPDGVAVLIVHSGVERGLVDSAYNDRGRQCEDAAAHYGVAALRDLDTRSLEAGRNGLEEATYRRARHVVTENARVHAFVDALQRGDLRELGDLMAASHASMRDDFEITVPAIDALAALIADAADGEGGARMTGGGFGGCIVALLPEDRVDHVRSVVEKDYRTPSGEIATIMRGIPSAGVSIIEGEIQSIAR
ncbi:galactokinase [Parasphingopyxis sp.]|uniref:galactokinase n=1 Tax=Parasphingopyxis sp. TaxID=1920299 RepID=UPI00262BCC79|nr:galactokinase [Parasphingopyxis sp.]